MRASRALDAACGFAAAAVFLALHLSGAGAHAIHPDEADLLFPMVGVLEQAAALFRECAVLHVAGRSFPIMVHPYHGPYEAYLTLPFIAAFGATSEAVFYRTAFYDALTSALVSWATLAVFKSRAAALLAGLLWACAGFSLSSDFGVFWGTSVIGMTLLAAIYGIRWMETRRASALIAASAWLGLACATRTWTLALPVAVLACLPLIRREFRSALAAAGPGRLAAAAFAFAASFIPFLIGNVMDGWRTARVLLAVGVPAAQTAHLRTPWRVRWLSLWEVLQGHSNRFLLIGNERLAEAAPTYAGWALSLAAAVVLSAALAARLRGGAPQPRRHVFLLSVFGVFCLLAQLSPTNHNANHLYPVLPFLYMNLAALPLIFTAGARRAAWAMVAAVAAASAISGVSLTWSYQERARAKGGSGPESSLAIVDLTRWLETQRISAPILASVQDIGDSLRYYSRGSVIPDDLAWGFDPSAPADLAPWKQAACAGRREFIVVLDPLPERSALPALASLARGCGRALKKVREFPSLDGRVVFEVHRAVSARSRRPPRSGSRRT